MNKLQSYFIASVLYVMTPHAFAQGTVTIYLPGEQQTLSVGPVENVVQLVTQPQRLPTCHSTACFLGSRS